MIVNIRGTGGAGKSHIVREVMKRYDTVTPVYIDGRRRPFGYVCFRQDERLLYVPGHYETACGGCDTITNIEGVYASVRAAALAGQDVLFEGIISQDDVTRTVALHRDYPVLVIWLDVPLAECLAAIAERREARGDARPLNPRNTTERAKRVAGIIGRLKDSGVATKRLGREAALAATLEALRCPVIAS